MTSRRDIERLLDHWLDDGPTEIARPRSSTWSPTGSTASRSDPRGASPGGTPSMTTHLKLAVAAAAVLVIAVGGIDLLRRPSTGVGGTRAAVGLAVGVAIAIAHRHPRLRRRAPCSRRGTRRKAAEPGSCRQAATTTRPLPAPAPRSPSRRAGSTTATTPRSTACSRTRPPTRPSTPVSEVTRPERSSLRTRSRTTCSPSAMRPGCSRARRRPSVIDAVVANQALSATEPVDVTIGGLIGRQIDVQLDPDLDGELPAQPDDPPNRDYTDARTRVILLDTRWSRPSGSSSARCYSSDFEAFLAEAMPIVESFQFDVGPEASPSPDRAATRGAGASPRGSRASPARARSPRTAP